MKQSLSAPEFADILRSGFTYLDLNRALLDRLNVFPVPDGDTGANMTSTLAAGVDVLDLDPPESFEELGRLFNRELTRSSRGNSGFILARFFQGFFEALGDVVDLDAGGLSKAVANGRFQVNGALFAPAEGTMISIFAAMDAVLADLDTTAVEDALIAAESAASEALRRTPEQLPVLARAGVMDSGALGLLFILRGMIDGLLDRRAQVESEDEYRVAPNPNAADPDDGDSGYRFCTEAVVRRNDRDDPELRRWLPTVGDSIALVDDGAVLKIHIHTDDPRSVFDRLELLGELEHTKVDDMAEQTRLITTEGSSEHGVSVLAFIPGGGFESIFEDLGVQQCFEYGDTLPSPEEIAAVLASAEADHVIVLPNNSNILPSVQIAGDLSDKALSIIPTTSVVQGITAAYGFSDDATAAENLESMQGFLGDAVDLALYRSVRDSVYGDLRIPQGDWFVTRSDQVLGVASTPARAVVRALEQLDCSEFTESTIYHGDGFDPRDLEEVSASMQRLLPGADIDDHYGGQRRAALIISLE